LEMTVVQRRSRSYYWSSFGADLLHQLFSYAVKYPSALSRIQSIIREHVTAYCSDNRRFVSHSMLCCDVLLLR